MTTPKTPSSLLPDDLGKLASSLVVAWNSYTHLFGEAPHGTEKQMRALLRLIPAALRAAPAPQGDAPDPARYWRDMYTDLLKRADPIEINPFANEPPPPGSDDASVECTCGCAEMLWKWFGDESRCGAEYMRAEMPEGLSADDFKTMLDEHEAALASPPPAGREALEKLIEMEVEKFETYSDEAIFNGKNVAFILQTLLTRAALSLPASPAPSPGGVREALIPAPVGGEKL